MLDPNGIITNWNRGAQRIKGYRTEEIVGRTSRSRRVASAFAGNVLQNYF
jgi:PAS domain S-box-containing protein